MLKKHFTIRLTTEQIASRFWCWIKNDFCGIAREMRWSYLPPLMVYFAAGVSGFTGIIESLLQDVVADAMTVEAVPTRDEAGDPIPEKTLQHMHVTMQTLGRIAIVGGGAMVAGVGGWLANAVSYELMYWISLSIPLISILGVLLGSWMRMQDNHQRLPASLSPEKRRKEMTPREQNPTVNWYILGGSAVFVVKSP